jgi:hypothetical protein
MYNVVCLYPPKRAEFTRPMGARPTDEFQPVRVCDDSLVDLGIHKDDLLAANLSLTPEEGQLSFIKTLQVNLLGYFFPHDSDWAKIESVCTALCCPPEYIRLSDIHIAAPIVWAYRSSRGASWNFTFRKFRSRRWKEKHLRAV